MTVHEPSQQGTAVQLAQEIDETFQVEDIASILSKERLKKYYERVGHGNSTKAIDLYCWNHQIGAAFNVSLQQFEVCLRNSISIAMRAAFGLDWFMSNRLRGYTSDIRILIEKAYDKAKENRSGFTPAEGDFIAASSLSLWRELSKPAFAPFWSKRITLSFPHMPSAANERKALEDIHGRIQRLAKLRNRLAHHEHVLGSHKEKVGQMLYDRHTDMFTLTEWMSPSFAAWMRQRDRLQELVSECPIADLVVAQRSAN